ncbi:valine--tRNA ligase [Candidatus Saccharibacteria bacterium]|nr:valine--tRNA ligase [Candidatus Saccharibacteria bacterium]
MKLPKAYTPQDYEDDIYALWEKSGVFFADPTTKKERFTISMPPPNETGTLSLGHALFLTLQDIMIRHARQMGKDALWVPGTDHAALAVNAIIEKKLAEEGTNKHQIGREEFLKRTREFVGGSRETMLKQMRAMGASADWSRLRYTLDDALNRMVNETFVAMYNSGLIYRGHRIVNWDPNLETNVSDDEMQYVEEKTTFYTFKYGPFEISTARPETKFGDKYVVMHPDDERYKQFKHGDTFECEWINGPITATIIKDEAIDMNFGTGVMTITPWHDHTDFEIAERHGLDKEQIIDLKGALMPIAGEFEGLPIETARGRIVEKLRKKGLVVKEEEYVHNVAINERGKGKIEPQIRLQWFVDVNKPSVDWKGKNRSLKEVMKDVITSGDITITPKRFEKIYFQWIDNLRDWCITRQIWWGHRVPVWYRKHVDGSEETFVGVQAPTDSSEGWNEWEQDPDTLDTWFSSALWTWSTLIDQEKAADYSLSLGEIFDQSPDFKAYHPTNVMETGWDILFFWVARMVLSTTFMTGQVPFKKVYLHGMVRAEDGKKMSKSRPESIIDPLEVIPQYGTDALRMALIWGTSPGLDFNWSTPKIEATRNFANKLWNIARYSEGILGDQMPDFANLKLVSAADHWVVAKLQKITSSVAKDIDAFRFSEAFDSLYHFVWDDVADWYIEASKSSSNPILLAYVLQSILKLIHPFAPFVSETIWQTLDITGDGVLISEPWPDHSAIKSNSGLVDEFETIRTIVTEARFITSRLNAQKCTLYYRNAKFLGENAELIAKLAKLAGVKEVESGQGMHLTSVTYDCWLDIDSNTAKQYAEKLKADRIAKQGVIDRLEARLANADYIKKAPKEMVSQTKDQLETEKELLAKLDLEIGAFNRG